MELGSGGTAHLKANITFSPPWSTPSPLVAHPRGAGTPSRMLLGVILGDVATAGAAEAALTTEAHGGARVGINNQAGDQTLGEVESSGAAAAGYLLHPAVGDACIHIAAIPGGPPRLSLLPLMNNHCCCTLSIGRCSVSHPHPSFSIAALCMYE